MRALRRASRKSKMRGPYPTIVLFLSMLGVSLFVMEGLASQEVIPQGPVSEKGLLPRHTTKNNTSSPYTQSQEGTFYNPAGKTDPFKSFIAEQEAIEEKKKKKPKTYLETLDLSQLDLIAIILSPKANWAMVRDAKGIGYVIRKGTPIGINEGVVHQIREKEVIIREKLLDLRKGEVTFRDIAKKLYTSQQ